MILKITKSALESTGILQIGQGNFIVTRVLSCSVTSTILYTNPRVSFQFGPLFQEKFIIGLIILLALDFSTPLIKCLIWFCLPIHVICLVTLLINKYMEQSAD